MLGKELAMRNLILGAFALAAVPAAAQDQGQHRQHGAAQQQPAAAPAADQAAVLATIDRMFAALAAKDGAALLAEVVPEGRATATTESGRMSSRSWPEFAGHLAQIPGRPVERLISPHVHVEGNIAMIWSRYEIELDGRFLHCGVDHFDLVRQDGRWRVLNLTWTQQTQGCPSR
jgi:hypothetical protein